MKHWFNKFSRYIISLELLIFAVLFCCISSRITLESSRIPPTQGDSLPDTRNCLYTQVSSLETDTSEQAEEKKAEKDFIKWVDFTLTAEAMQAAYEMDVNSHETAHPVSFIPLLSYLGALYGGDFSQYKQQDLESLIEKGSSLIKAKQADSFSQAMALITEKMKYYSYYNEIYTAVLSGMVGDYEKQDSSGRYIKCYGLKAFHPIAKGFPYSDYDDFGVSRSYGYQRNHLGHDLMGQVGTPIIAVESGIIEAMGWNQYGGWRLGIRSFDKKRYYYYAHLRKDFPYCKSLKEGDKVNAGDVIGYMGRTGYSTTENTNNIDESHLHFGLQLIFDESQKECNNEIWIDCYELIKFLYQNQSETLRDDATKEWHRLIPTR